MPMENQQTQGYNPQADAAAPAQDMTDFNDLLGTDNTGVASPPASSPAVPETPVEPSPPENPPVSQTPENPAQAAQDAQAAKPVEDVLDDSILLDVMLNQEPVQAQQQPQPQAQQGEPQQIAKYEPFPEPVNIPDNVINNLFSDDPNVVKQTLGAMLATTANAAANAALVKAREEYENYFKQQQQTQAQQQVGQQMQQQIRNDFYTAFPDLDKYPKVVQQVTKVLISRAMAADPNASWTPALRDEIGKYSRAMIAKIGVSKPTAPIKPAEFMQMNARPPMQNVTPSPEGSSGVDDLVDNIF